MKNDFILDEAELSIAANKIEFMIESLIVAIDEYETIMKSVTTLGINNLLVNSKIQSLITQMQQQKIVLIEIKDSFLKDIVNAEISDTEAVDTFVYPFDLLTEVTSLLSQFF